MVLRSSSTGTPDMRPVHLFGLVVPLAISGDILGSLGVLPVSQTADEQAAQPHAGHSAHCGRRGALAGRPRAHPQVRAWQRAIHPFSQQQKSICTGVSSLSYVSIPVSETTLSPKRHGSVMGHSFLVSGIPVQRRAPVKVRLSCVVFRLAGERVPP